MPLPLLDLLVPVRCVLCESGETLLCAACRSSLPPVRPPLCARCGAPTAWPVARCRDCAGRRLPFVDARSAVAYEGAARAFVAGWKEGGLRLLAGAAGDVVAERVPRPPADVIAFVPGDRERTLWRGPNTAEELARALGQRWRLPVQPLLARSRSVPPQRGLSRPARRRNVRGSFRAASGSRGRVVLVDDVYTTGATASVAAAELRRAGAHAVHVVTFARAVRR